MKHLLAALLCLLTLSYAYGQAWPRNPTTGKVEFRGTLPWPAGVKTEAQRRTLVRRWYLAKLTDESVQAVDEEARTVVSPTLLTYAGLPIGTVLLTSKQPSPGILSYIVGFKAQADALSYHLGEFTFRPGRTGALSSRLEQVLVADSAADRLALAALRRRLADAVAHW